MNLSSSNYFKTITKNADETQKFGEEFADQLKGGEVLALVGNLGSGKTTFIQGLAKGLKINQKIISPTFILVREYETKAQKLYHLDLYRLEENINDEIKKLGIKDQWEKRENIVVIEWADKAKDSMPKSTIWITFEGQGDEERKIIVSNK